MEDSRLVRVTSAVDIPASLSNARHTVRLARSYSHPDITAGRYISVDRYKPQWPLYYTYRYYEPNYAHLRYPRDYSTYDTAWYKRNYYFEPSSFYLSSFPSYGRFYTSDYWWGYKSRYWLTRSGLSNYDYRRFYDPYYLSTYTCKPYYHSYLMF